MDAVLNWMWQGTAVALVAAATVRARPRSRASMRHTVWLIAAACVLLLPVLTSLRASLAHVDPLAAHESVLRPLIVRDAWWTMGSVVAAGWGAWVMWFGGRLGLAALALHRARKAALAIPPDLAARLPWWNRVSSGGRRARLVLSEAVGTAAVLGGPQPLIAVSPLLAERLPPDDLDRIVLHEWMHVQRRDDLAHVAQLLAEAIAGWHPAVWWMGRRLRAEREHACDEGVLDLTGAGKAYASTLLEIARLPRNASVAFVAPGASPHTGLRQRISRILAHGRVRPAGDRPHLSVACTSVVLAAVLACGFTAVEVRAVMPDVAVLRSFVRHVEFAAMSASGSAPAPPAAARRDPPGAPQPGAGGHQPILPSSGLPEHRFASRGEPVEHPLSDEPSPLLSRTIASVWTTIPPQPRDDERSSTWRGAQAAAGAAAGAGLTIGRRSQQAAAATAGFFSRFGRGVAEAVQP